MYIICEATYTYVLYGMQCGMIVFINSFHNLCCKVNHAHCKNLKNAEKDKVEILNHSLSVTDNP